MLFCGASPPSSLVIIFLLLLFFASPVVYPIQVEQYSALGDGFWGQSVGPMDGGELFCSNLIVTR
uniref:Uncharacterized protein n=1 Tax=Romanomermis culicivorax TaxID=13658 RepID=A0A915KX93_ROMCU